MMLLMRVRGPMPGIEMARFWGIRIVFPIRILALPKGLPERKVPEWYEVL
jgi:hypothetical protein